VHNRRENNITGGLFGVGSGFRGDHYIQAIIAALI